ncbi:hypothetical protein JW865_09185 [Candidatus Bathyarchaeota archaeon]|nr:hypothetical protein [Candidatus Bathyarchaeota archaeon]
MVILSVNNGQKMDDAIIITEAKSHAEGIISEYEYLEKHYGRIDKDWKFRQHFVEIVEKKYDKFEVILKNGEKYEVWFDITQPYTITRDMIRNLLI